MQTAQVTIDVPMNISKGEAKLLLSVKLYETGKLSLGQAAELAGYTYRSFLEVLGVNKIPVANYSAADIENELPI